MMHWHARCLAGQQAGRQARCSRTSRCDYKRGELEWCICTEGLGQVLCVSGTSVWEVGGGGEGACAWDRVGGGGPAATATGSCRRRRRQRVDTPLLLLGLEVSRPCEARETPLPEPPPRNSKPTEAERATALEGSTA